MAITGFTADSVSNGLNIVTTTKTGLTATIINDQVSLVNGGRLNGSVTIDSSQIYAFNPPDAGDATKGSNGIISYNNGGDATNMSAAVRLRNQSSLLINATDDFPAGGSLERYTILITEISDSFVIETNTRSCIVYLQPSATLQNASLRGVAHVPCGEARQR